MEHIEEHIEERLWNSIRRNYNSENYTNAILDSIQFIGDVIREKSGLESDGNPLIGSAFGGANPKIKINKLKTESEKNVQKGIESILRGVYSAYRNPRSHSKIKDSEQDAFAIIIFINHLLKLIDKSKGKFSTELFLKRVFDKDFVQSQKYADLIVKDVPKNKLFEVTIEIFRQKENGKIHNLNYIWKSVYCKLSYEEKKEIIDLVSEELRFTDSLKSVIRCIALFENEWNGIDEDSRLRAENKIIQIISLAEKNHHGQTNEFGIYASWLTSIIKNSSLRSEIAEKLYESIESRDQDRQRFVLDYYKHYLEDLESELFFVTYKDLFKKELKNGNDLIYSFITTYYAAEKQLEYKEELDNFVNANHEDNLPF